MKTLADILPVVTVGFLQLFPTQLLTVWDVLFIFVFPWNVRILCRMHMGFLRKAILKEKKFLSGKKNANRKFSTPIAWVLLNVPSLNWSRSEYQKNFFSYVNTSLVSDCLSLNPHNFPGSLCCKFAEGSHEITPQVLKMKIPLLWLALVQLSLEQCSQYGVWKSMNMLQIGENSEKNCEAD